MRNGGEGEPIPTTRPRTRTGVDLLSKVAVRRDPLRPQVPITLDDKGIRGLQRKRMIEADNHRASALRRDLRAALKLPDPLPTPGVE